MICKDNVDTIYEVYTVEYQTLATGLPVCELCQCILMSPNISAFFVDKEFSCLLSTYPLTEANELSLHTWYPVIGPLAAMS